MYKNQLQELAQRSALNLPSYSCIREGPDHAPKFKATVNFNGETFESPGFFSALRQAEHAAAEVALNVLAKRGPSKDLASKILDETGVCKNLLQETAQRAGVCLPTYSTVRSGPGHLPVFICTVEVAGMQFTGDHAKTKKQAEKNAAMIAWTALKKYAAKINAPSVTCDDSSVEFEQNSIAKALASTRLTTNSGSYLPPMASVHQRNAMRIGYDDRSFSRAMPPNPVYAPNHLGSSWRGRDERMNFRETGYPDMYPPPQLPMRTLPHPGHQMILPPLDHDSGRHTNIAIKPGMAYRPSVHSSQMMGESSTRSIPAYQPRFQVSSMHNSMARQSTSVTLKPLMDEHEADEAAWLRGESSSNGLRSPINSRDLPQEVHDDRRWSVPSTGQYWPTGRSPAMGEMSEAGDSLAGPVTVRTLVTVHAAPSRFVEVKDEESPDDEITRQMFSNLNL